MKKEKVKILTALGIGSIIGGLAGVLFAPRSGSETRAKIKESIVNLKENLTNIKEEDVKKYIDKKLDEIDKEVNKLEKQEEYKKARRQAKKIINKINRLINYTNKKGMDKFEDLILDLKEKASNISEEVLTYLED